MTVLIRPRESTDERFILDLGALAFREFGPRARRNVGGMLREPGFTRVALRGGAPVGFAIVAQDGGQAVSLNAIAVLPDERGRGVGSALLDAAIHEAARRGGKVLRLVTADSNLAALDLFLKHGFQIERRVRRYYARGQDAVVLQRPLAAAPQLSA